MGDSELSWGSAPAKTRARRMRRARGAGGRGRAAEAEELSRDAQQLPGHGEHAGIQLARASVALCHALAGSLLGGGGIGGCRRSARCGCMGTAVPR